MTTWISLRTSLFLSTTLNRLNSVGSVVVAGLVLVLVVLGESANSNLEKLHISYPMARILFSVYFSDCFGFILLEFNSLDP